MEKNYGGPTVVEAYNEWKDMVDNKSSFLDRDVLNRMLMGKKMTQSSVKTIYDAEENFSKQLYSSIDEYDAILFPTVQILPPTITEVQESSETYNKYNKLALKNTRIANSLRLCAISLPCTDDLPVGIMLCMSINKDEKLLNFAENIYNIIK